MVCRTSFVQTGSEQIVKGQTKLISVHAVRTGAPAPATIKLYDVDDVNDIASSNEICRMSFPSVDPNANIMAEFDMHGVLCTKGIYLEITGSAAVSVEFA